jgi:hypothetical protein
MSIYLNSQPGLEEGRLQLLAMSAMILAIKVLIMCYLSTTKVMCIPYNSRWRQRTGNTRSPTSSHSSDSCCCPYPSGCVSPLLSAICRPCASCWPSHCRRTSSTGWSCCWSTAACCLSSAVSKPRRFCSGCSST